MNMNELNGVGAVSVQDLGMSGFMDEAWRATAPANAWERNFAEVQANAKQYAEKKRRESERERERAAAAGVLHHVWLYDDDKESAAAVDASDKYALYASGRARLSEAMLPVYGRDYAEAVMPGAAGDPWAAVEAYMGQVTEEGRKAGYRQEFDALKLSGKDTADDYYALLAKMVRDDVRGRYDAFKAEEARVQKSLGKMGRYAAGEALVEGVATDEGLTEEDVENVRGVVDPKLMADAEAVRAFMRTYIKPLEGEEDAEAIMRRLDGLEDELFECIGEDKQRAELVYDAMMQFAEAVRASNKVGIDDEFVVAVGKKLSDWGTWSEEKGKQVGSLALGALALSPGMKYLPWGDELAGAALEQSAEYLRTVQQNNARKNARSVLRGAINRSMELGDDESLWKGSLRAVMQMTGDTLPYLASYVVPGAGAYLGTQDVFVRGMTETQDAYELQGLTEGQAMGQSAIETGVQAAVELLPWSRVGGKGLSAFVRKGFGKGVANKTVGAFSKFAVRMTQKSVPRALASEFTASVIDEGVLEPIAGGLMTWGAEWVFDGLGIEHNKSREFYECFDELKQIWGDPRQAAGLLIFSAGLTGASIPGIKQNVRYFAQHRKMWEAKGLKPSQVDELMAIKDIGERIEKGSQMVDDEWAANPAEMSARQKAANKAIKERGEVLVLTGEGALDAELENSELMPAYRAVWNEWVEQGLLPKVEQQADGQFKLTQKGKADKVLSAAHADAYLQHSIEQAEEQMLKEARTAAEREQGVDLREMIGQAVSRLAGGAAMRAVERNGERAGIVRVEDITRGLPEHLKAPILAKGQVNLADAKAITEWALGQIRGLVEGGMSERDAYMTRTEADGMARSLGEWTTFARDFAHRETMAGLKPGQGAITIGRTRVGEQVEFDGKELFGQVLMTVPGGVSHYGAVEDVTESVVDMTIQRRAQVLQAEGGVSAQEAEQQAWDELYEMVSKAREVVMKAEPSAEIEEVKKGDTMSIIEALSTMARAKFLSSGVVPRWMQSLTAGLKGLMGTGLAMEKVRAAYASVLENDAGALAELEGVLADVGVRVQDVFREARIEAVDIQAAKAAGAIAGVRAERGVGGAAVSDVVQQAEEAEREIVEDEKAEDPAADKRSQREVAEEDKEKLEGMVQGSNAPVGMQGVFVEDKCYYNAAGRFWCGMIAKDKLRDGTEQVKVGAKGKHGVIQGKELTGKFQHSVGAIYVWMRKNGELQVISGRHRFAKLMEDEQALYCNCYVYQEDAEHDERWARMLDYENNMRDDQADEVTAGMYVRETGLSDAELKERGLMRNGTRCKRGAFIGRHAREELWTRFVNGAVKPKDAEIICELTRTISAQDRVEEIQARCCMLLDAGKGWEYIGAMVQLMANKENVVLRQGLLDFGADFEAELSRAAEWIEKNIKRINESITLLKQGKKLSGKKKAEAERLGITTATQEGAEEMLRDLELLKKQFEFIGSYPDLVAQAQMWDGVTEVDPVGYYLENARKERLEAELEGEMTAEEYLEAQARKEAQEAVPSLFSMEMERGRRIAAAFHAVERMAAVEVSVPDVYVEDTKVAKGAIKLAYDELRENPVEMRDGRVVLFSGKGFKEVTRHAADRRALACLAKMRELAKGAIYLYSAPNTQKDIPSKRNIEQFHYYVVKGNFPEYVGWVKEKNGGAGVTGAAYVLIAVAESRNGNIFYDLDATDVEAVEKNKGATDVLEATRIPNPGRQDSAPKGRIHRIKEFVNYIDEQKANNFSAGQSTFAMDKNLAAEMDERYMAAVKRGDMDAAQRMVNDVARRRGYMPDSEYQGSECFNGPAPSSNAYFDSVDERYEAWENGEFEGTVSLADFVRRGMDPGELEWLVTSPGAYQRADEYKRESIEAIRKAKAGKRGKVTIYRAVPADIKESSVRNGDWVTFSKAYAEYHISLQDWEKGRIIKQAVSIDDVWWDGNDVNEWGYDDGKEYAYRNTANNRKLLDAVTYDTNGDIVPLSKRFDYRSNNVSFSVIGKRAQNWDKNLAAVHTLTAENFLSALELGGMPLPSVAITRLDKPYDWGGASEINLIGRPEMVDPRRAEVYSRDAWSGSFPRVEHKVIGKRAREVASNDLHLMRKMYQKAGDFDSSIHQLDYRINMGYGGGETDRSSMEYGLRQKAGKALFAWQSGYRPRAKKRAAERKHEWLTPEFADSLRGYMELSADEYHERLPEIRELVRAEIERVYGEKFIIKNAPSAEAAAKRLNTWVNVAERQFDVYSPYELGRHLNDVKLIGAKVLDIEANLEMLAKYADKHKRAYEAWVQERLGEWFSKERYIKGTGRLATLENLTAYMLDRKARGNEEGLTFSTGRVRAYQAEALNSMEEIKARRDTLTDGETSRGMKEVTNEWMQEWREGAAEILSRGMSGYGFSVRDDLMEVLSKVKGKPTMEKLRSAVRRVLRGAGHLQELLNNAEVMNAGLEALNSMHAELEDYMEAVPQRAVGMSEWEYAVMPEGLKKNKAVMAGLRENGIRAVFHDGTMEGRNAALAGLVNNPVVSFSVVGQKAKNWDKIKDRAFVGRDDGKLRVELDASKSWVVADAFDTDAQKAFRRILVAAYFEELPEADTKMILDYAKALDEYKTATLNMLEGYGKGNEAELEAKARAATENRKKLMAPAHATLVRLFEQEGVSKIDKVLAKAQMDHLVEDFVTQAERETERVAADLAMVGKKDYVPLGEYLKFDELYEAYPELSKTEVYKGELADNLYGYVHSGWGKSVIMLNSKHSRWTHWETLLHEVQHLIQDIESFAVGGDAEFAMDRYKRLTEALYITRKIEETEFTLRWLNGEAEARAKYKEFKKAKAEGASKKRLLEMMDEYNTLVLGLNDGRHVQTFGYKKWAFSYEYWLPDLDGISDTAVEIADAVWADVKSRKRAFPGLEKKMKAQLEGLREKAATDEILAKKLEGKSGHELYQRLAGEIEARNVEQRKNWSMAHRAEVPFNDTLEFPGEALVTFSIRKKEAPKRTGVGYKVFYRRDGKLYPPMVANPGGVDTPVGVWLDADEGVRAGTSKTGRPKVKAGGKGTQGGGGTLAYRPGWHLGKIPYAIQFNRKNPVTGERDMFPADFVWAEVEYAADVDYQEEAMAYGKNKNGKFQHSLAGLPRVPEDGYYEYRTNPNPETDPWIITGAMKVNRVLDKAEVDELVRAAGREPQKVQGMSFSMERASLQALEVLRTRADEREGERLMEDWQKACEMWGQFAGAEGESRLGNGAKMLGEIHALIGATKGVLPERYTHMGHLNGLLRWAAVYAQMQQTGEVPMHGVIKGEIYERFVNRMEENAMRESNYGLSAAEVREALATLAGERLDVAVLKVANECKRRLELFLKDRERERIDWVVERAYPKRERGKRTPRGKMDADTYRRMERAYQLMDMEPNAVAGLIERLKGALDKLETAPAEAVAVLEGLRSREVPDVTEAEALEEALEDELFLAQTFGAWENMAFEQARMASGAMAELVLMGKNAWQDKLKAERRRAAYDREEIMRHFTVKLEDMQQERGVKSAKEKGRKRTIAKKIAMGAMSYSQLLLALEPKLGKRFVGRQMRMIAEAHEKLMMENQRRHRWLFKTLAKITGLKTEGEIEEWMIENNTVIDTGVDLEMPMKSKCRLTPEEAKRWLSMKAEEREEARRKAVEEANAKGEKPDNIPGEDVMEELEERYVNAELDDAMPKEFVLETAWTYKSRLHCTKEALMFAILTFEQDDYEHLLEVNGLTAGKLQKLRELVGTKLLRWGYAMRKELGEHGRTLAEVYERYTGVPFGQRNNYFRGVFDVARSKDMGEAVDQTGGVMGGKYGILISRQYHNQQLNWQASATAVFVATMREQANYIATAHISREWRTLLSDRLFERRLRAEIGDAALDMINGWCTMIDGAVLADAKVNALMHRFLGRVMGAYAVSRLAGNVYTIMKQVSALLNGFVGGYVPEQVMAGNELVRELTYRHVGFGEYLGALAKAMAGQTEISIKELEDAGFIAGRQRVEGSHVEDAALLAPGQQVPGKVGRMARAFHEANMDAIGFVDRKANARAALAIAELVYQKGKAENKDGLVPDEVLRSVAIQTAGMMVDRAAQPQLRTQKGYWAAGGGAFGALGNLFYMFKSEVLAKIGLYIAQMMNGRHGAWIVGALSYGVMNSVVLALIDWICGRWYDDDEDKWEMRSKQFVFDVAFNDIGTVPILGDAFSFMRSEVLDEPYWSSSVVDMLLPLKDIYKYGEREVKYLVKGDEPWDKHVTALCGLARGAGAFGGWFLGTGGKAVNSCAELSLAVASISNTVRFVKDVVKKVVGED